MSRPGLGGPSGWSGGRVAPSAQCLLAANPSPMTLDGTNTWLLHGSDPAHRTRVLVVDPGPALTGHENAISAAVAALDCPPLVLLTHGHPDHSENAKPLAGRLGVKVLAADPGHRLGEEGLSAGQRLQFDDIELQVVQTPGHTTDSVCFLLIQHGTPDPVAALVTGDTVLGRGTSVIAHPDGVLGPYLDSLRILRELVARTADRLQVDVQVWPGHGPVLKDAATTLDYYLDHRQERLEQVRAALAAGDSTADEVVARVYADVDRVLWPAARLSVLAQLDYLRGYRQA